MCMRVKRGTLPSEREGGRLYVYLTAEPTSEPTDRTGELIDELKDLVRSLKNSWAPNARQTARTAALLLR